MKELQVPEIACLKAEAEAIPALFKSEHVPYQLIATANWHETYPHQPEVRFAMAHNNHAIFLHFCVQEDYARAVVDTDGGHVWEDSCCEFFVSPDEKTGYYNLETNCIGRALLCHGAGREGRKPAPNSVIQAIQRWTSLGTAPFPARESCTAWQLALVIPTTSFFDDNITELSGRTMRANFYKCGDKTLQPHFLSWSPIQSEKPDFHRPEDFGIINFL